MKISISYPPLESGRGTPLLSQNRQFQWFCNKTFIYPMVPAYAATLLNQAGYDVVWDDAIAREKIYHRWLKEVDNNQFDVMMIETKTPVVKAHWKIIDDIKEVCPRTIVALVGDHVTALPMESMENSNVDYILTGGDYDFLLLNLVEYMDGQTKVLESGIWYREEDEIKNTGSFILNHNLDSLPFLNRDLTDWKLYAYNNGNFKVTPGTYILSARDCWWRKNGGCTFCSWTTLYPSCRSRQPQLVVDEVELLVEKYNVKEVFDDSGTFPVGRWLKNFCDFMIERKLNEKIYFGANMRLGVLNLENYELMKKAGFRMLLFGLESANQKTLDKLNKGVIVNNIIEDCKNAKASGLEPHLTIMIGYPWETKEDAWNTFELAKKIFENGWADTLQVTIVIPYPGTRLFREVKEKGFLKSLDWDEYDMRKPVMSSLLSDEDVEAMAKKTYSLFLNPRYIARKVLMIRNVEDLKFAMKGARKVLSHIKDFSREKP